MTKRTQTELAFPSCKSKNVTAGFRGGNISSIGGAVLIEQTVRQLGLIRASDECIRDLRWQASLQNLLEQMIGQRVFAIACGSRRSLRISWSRPKAPLNIPIVWPCKRPAGSSSSGQKQETSGLTIKNLKVGRQS